jgi:hypothetical protein
VAVVDGSAVVVVGPGLGGSVAKGDRGLREAARRWRALGGVQNCGPVEFGEIGAQHQVFVAQCGAPGGIQLSADRQATIVVHGASR